MSNLKDYTETQLLKFMNDAERDHNETKEKIKHLLDEIKPLEIQMKPLTEKLNKEMDVFDSIEKRYVLYLQELNSRGR